MQSSTLSASDAVSERGRGTHTHRIAALDGIRGVAVLSVMFFHFGVTFVPGGFLGVDIFFVLSGFLITSILLREYQRSEHINLGRFWSHRARRLFPALGLMLVVVAIAASMSSAATQKTVFGEGIATILYSNNWYLIFNDTSYFGQFQSASPLLHTWSLGVEEQWYVVFPLALIVLCLWTARQPRLLVGLLFGGALVSFVWGWYLTVSGASVDRIYFGTDVRSQELLIGAALAAVLAHQGLRERLNSFLGKGIRALGWIGTAVVALMLLLVDGSQRWQYTIGLFVLSLAVAAVIWSVLHSAGTLTAMLAWRPLVFVGLISYGLYLWHWPIFVWIKGPLVTLGFLQVLSTTILTFAVAIASYYLLEGPVRRRRWFWTTGHPGWLAAVIAPIVIAGALAGCTQDRAQVVDGVSSEVVPAPAYVGSGPKVFLLGDSISQNLRGMFPQVPSPGFSLTGTTYLGCWLLPNELYVDGQSKPINLPCKQWYDQWHEDLVESHPDLTIIMLPLHFRHDVKNDEGQVVTFGTPAHKAFILEQLDQVTKAALKGAPKVAYINGTCTRVPGQNSVARQLNDDERMTWVNGVLDEYLKAHPEVSAIDLTGWDCGRDSTEATANAAARKSDGMHYNTDASLEAWQQLAPQIRVILARNPPAVAGGN